MLRLTDLSFWGATLGMVQGSPPSKKIVCFFYSCKPMYKWVQFQMHYWCDYTNYNKECLLWAIW